MKKAILLLMLCMAGLAGRAHHYFNQRNTLHSFSSQIRSVIIHNSKYYCTGFGIDSVNDLGNGMAYTILGLKFCVFDEQGNKIVDTVWQKPKRQLICPTNSLYRLHDGTFLTAMDAVDTASMPHRIVACFDSVGHHLWDREYEHPFCPTDTQGFLRLVDFKPTPTGNWLMLSTINCSDFGDADLLLTKLDSGFNIIWQKKYGDPQNTDLAGKLLIENDGYVIGSDEDNNNRVLSNYNYYAKMIKVDTGGNVIWTWRSSNTRKTNGINDLIRTQDGGYLYCGGGMGIEQPTTGRYNIFFKGWVEKIDANRNSVWGKSFAKYYSSQFNSIKETPSGNILLFGEKHELDKVDTVFTDNHIRGWFLTLNANGDSLRERTYSGINSSNDYNAFNDAKQTADGGFIMGGLSIDYSPARELPVQRGWLVKVDSNGCASPTDPQCWALGLPVTPSALNETKVYPNPVTNQLTISYQNKTNQGSVFQFTDITGKLLFTQPLTGKSGAETVDVSRLANGMYLYRIVEGTVTTQQGKVVKQ